MIIIRLQRRGRKNDPSFRVIVVDSKRAAKTGDFLEVVGNYDPRVDRVELKADRIKHWMSEGAQVSDTVHNILINAKVIEGKKRNVLPKKTVPKPAPAEASGKEEAAPAAEASAKAEVPAEAPADLPAEAPAQAEAAPEVPAAPTEEKPAE